MSAVADSNVSPDGGGGGGGGSGDEPATHPAAHEDRDASVPGQVTIELPDRSSTAAAAADDDAHHHDSGDDHCPDNDDAGAKAPGHGHSHGGHGHSHGGHGHSHGGHGKSDDKCEWNYINIIIAVFCTILLALLLGLLIFWLVLNTGPVKTYYIGIENVEWSYTPRGNLCGGDVNSTYSVFADGSAADRVGATYRKARYVQYTDETFTTRTNNDSEAVGQLGILGPVLRASVGETLRVYVRNDASFPFSINPWGLRIAKASEGAGYDDGSFFFEKYEDSIAPLAINQYTCTGFGIDQRTGCRPFLVHPGQYLMQDWPVTKEAGPLDGDGNSVLWLYTSDVDGQIEAGINAGLVGAIIIDAAEADADASLPAPGLEFVNVFLSSDENESPYLDMNMWEHVVEASYGHVVAGWVPFGFLDQADVLRGLYARAVQSAKAANPDAAGAPEQLSYAAAATLVNTSIAAHSPVATAEGVVIGVQFTDPTNNPADSNSFDPATFNGRYGDGAAQQVVHALFARALDELKNDEAFKASNVVKTINGLAFCNQPGLDVSVTNQDTVSQNSCASGDDCVVRWWTSAVGGEDSLHVPTWSGGLGTADLDVQVISGSTSMVDTTVGAMQAGTWVFGDGVVANAAAGAQSHFTVNNGADNLLAEARAAGNVVEVAIKAVQVQWDYLPGTEATSNCEVDQGATAPSQFAPSKFSVGSNYTKWRFVQCVDLVCSDTVDPADWQGITGPPLYVEEGQLLRVTLFNEVTEDITLVASGLLTENATAAVAATPSGSAVFEFYAPASASASALAAASASAAAGNSRAWVYHGSTEGQIHAGLLGGVVVVDAGQTDSATGLPDGTDHEFVLFLGNSDENLSPLAAENAVAGLTELRAALGALGDAEFAEVVARVARTNSDLTAGNVMAGVNGRALCTLEGLSAAPGQAVRFHLVGPPTDGTVHSGRVAGHDITVAGHRQQTASLFPGSAVSFTVVARSGDWEVSDGAAGFFNAGVRAEFKVSGGAADVAEGTKATRTFYVAADEVEWDYAPSGYNKCQHTDFSAAEDSAKYMLQGAHRIGRKYVKAQYRRYLNENFDTLQSGTVSRGNSASQHLGLLGTVMTAEVGDTLVVYFKNNLRFPANVVLPGPFQSAARAEQVHVDGTLGAELAGDNTLKPVAPGETVKYTWVVAEDMGPAAGDSNSVVYSYGAQVFDKAQGVTPEAMANAGLVGALIVVRAGELKSSQTMPKDINVEFIVLTGVLDENLSPYLRLNAQRYADDPFTIDYADPEFQESNRMRSINGLMFCNGEGWVANLFQTVRFYVLGTDSGIHALNLHGQSIVNAATKRNSFSASVAAGGTATGDSHLSSPGHWLLESSISTNTLLGAQEMFTVHPQVTQFLKQTAGGFHQRDSRQPTNFDNSVRGQS